MRGLALSTFFVAVGLALSAWAAEPAMDTNVTMAGPNAGLANAIENAPRLELERLVIPVTTVQRGALYRVPNPDGKSLDLLQCYFRGYAGPTTIAIIDAGSGEIKISGIPDNLQIHIAGDAIGPDGKLYIATPWGYRAERKGMELFVYDPATNELTDHGVVAAKLDGENRPLCVGTDGKIYGTGTYPDLDQVGCYQIDPATGATKDFGPIGPSLKPNGCWSKSIAADDTHVYVTTAHHERHLIAYDRAKGTWEVLATAENVGGDMWVYQDRYGCRAKGVKVRGTDGKPIEYWLYQGKAIVKKSADEAPPWPQPTPAKPWVIMPQGFEVFQPNADPKADGTAEIWYRTPATEAAVPADAAGAAREGWRCARYKVPTYPRQISRILALPDGRIFGNAGAYTGNFVYDPATGEAQHLGTIALSEYSQVCLDGKVYMSGYPSSPLYIYDLTKPWTANAWCEPGQKPVGEADPGANPLLRLRLREFAGTHYMLDAALGADSCVYFGGSWARDGSGGGLAWWNPTADAGGGFWKDLSNYRVNYLTSAAGGKYVVLATQAVEDSVLNKPKPQQGRLFIFDTAEKKVVRELDPVAGTEKLGPVAGGTGSNVIGLVADPAKPRERTILYRIDVEKGALVSSEVLPFPLRAPELKVGPDGQAWCFMGETLVRINPEDARITVVGKAGASGRLAFSGGNAYLTGSEYLRRILNVYAVTK